MQDRDKLENELQELRTVVDAFDGSLRRLAMGDLHQQIEQPLPRGYEGMRKDFNRGLASVSATIDTVLTRAREAHMDCGEVRESLKRTTDEQAARASAMTGLAADAGSAAETARSQSAHVEHVAAILHNARLDIRRPKDAAAEAVTAAQRTCQSLAALKTMTEEVRTLLRETALLSLNGGVNAAHAGVDGQEALDIAKNLHALTQQVGSTVETLTEATDAVVAQAKATSNAATQVTREFDAIDVYTEALDSQLTSLGESSRRHAGVVDALRSDLISLVRSKRPADETALPPDIQLGNMERAIADIERQASRYTEVRIVTPPAGPAPSNGRRSHLRLVKT